VKSLTPAGRWRLAQALESMEMLGISDELQ
jgi:hypothetical protein